VSCVPVSCVPVSCVPVSCVPVSCVPVSCVPVSCVPVSCVPVSFARCAGPVPVVCTAPSPRLCGAACRGSRRRPGRLSPSGGGRGSPVVSARSLIFRDASPAGAVHGRRPTSPGGEVIGTSGCGGGGTPVEPLQWTGRCGMCPPGST
ncbi:hypothetical protein E1281_33470, partial [Actinomadura sp. KC345]